MATTMHCSAVCLLAGRALGERLMMEAGGPRIHAKSAGEAAMHCNVQVCTAMHIRTLQCVTVPYCSVPYFTALYKTAREAVMHCNALYSIALACAVLGNTLHCT